MIILNYNNFALIVGNHIFIHVHKDNIYIGYIGNYFTTKDASYLPVFRLRFISDNKSRTFHYDPIFWSTR